MNILRIIFLLLLLCVLGFTGLLVVDFLRGDGNGIVGGINFAPIAKYTFYGFLAYSFWYAFKQKINWLQNTLMMSLVLVLTVVFLEWICGMMLRSQAHNAPKIEGPTHSMMFDKDLGYKPKPDTSHVGIRSKDDKIIYRIKYSTDANSLRITPLDTTKPRTKYAQFYGCSMTFGEGVQSNETMPYFFGEYDSTYRPYNFAYSGYGPHQMLARLETKNIQKIVREKTGIAFYIYINDHVNRVLGTMTNYGYNGGQAPYYHKVEGQLQHDGLFKEGTKVSSWIFEQLLKSNILKFFKIGYPFKITEQDYELTAEVMAQASRNYKNQFGNDNFYVIVYPTIIDSSLIIRLLKQKGVKVLDYSTLFNPLEKGYAIPDDEHPTGLANEILIKRLVRDLK